MARPPAHFELVLVEDVGPQWAGWELQLFAVLRSGSLRVGDRGAGAPLGTLLPLTPPPPDEEEEEEEEEEKKAEEGGLEKNVKRGGAFPSPSSPSPSSAAAPAFRRSLRVNLEAVWESSADGGAGAGAGAGVGSAALALSREALLAAQGGVVHVLGTLRAAGRTLWPGI